MKKSVKQAAKILIFLVGGCSFGFSAMLMSPYLQAVKKDSIYVLVECDTKDPVTVEYGMFNQFSSSQIEESISETLLLKPTYIHKVKLKELKTGTKYVYSVSQLGVSSGTYTFNTAVEEGASFRFAWMADCRTGTDIHSAIAANIKKANPRFSLYGGDLCADSTYSSYKSEFFLPNELALIAEVPFFNTVGNHESAGKNTYAFTQSPESSSGTQKYYSFDYGDLHVLVLNTELPATEESPQYKFAKADLEASKKAWKLVISHVPPYVDSSRGDNKNLVKMSKDLFEPGRVDMVISGHDHFYQHNLVNGIHYMVIGSAGAPVYASKSEKNYVLKNVGDHNYAIADVTPVSLHMVVYNDKEEVLDTVDLAKPNPIKQ